MFGDKLFQFYEEKEKNFETGFFNIDNVFINTNIPKGSIITIGARPGMGKTSFEISICNHLLEMGKKVLFCKLDSSEIMTEAYLVSVKTKISDSIALRAYDVEDFNKICDAVQFFNEKNLEILCKMNISIEEIEEKIKAVKPDIVFIDSVQCLKMQKAPNYTDAINLAVKDIKRIAIENNLIFVLISQLSRKPEIQNCRAPILSDLRSGSFLEDISDFILFIHRKYYYSYICSDYDCDDDYGNSKNEAEIIVGKNKFGETGKFYLKYERGLFKDFSSEDQIRKVDL